MPPFSTPRLRLVPWLQRGEGALTAFLGRLLTPATTAELPPTWQIDMEDMDASAWIAERGEQGTIYLVEEVADDVPVGLFMTFTDPAAGDTRIGYLFAEDYWGKGYASECLQGFVTSWQGARDSKRLLAGVSAPNRASQRVLEKAGFVQKGRAADDVLEYEWMPAGE